MSPLEFQMQLVFLVAMIIPFLIKQNSFNYFHGVIDPERSEPSLGRALLIFTAAAAAQLAVVWIGNMSDAPFVWYFSHLSAGIIFGAGLRLAMLSAPKDGR